MTFKAAIFDFNGTLFWDTAFHDEAFDIFLGKRGMHMTPDEKRAKIHGKGNPDIMRTIFGDQLTDTEVNDLTQEKEQIYRDLCVNDLQLAAGAEDLFNFLTENKVPFTIATSAGIENVAFYFEHMNLTRWFDFDKVAYNDGTLRGKPAPDVFLAAAKKLNLAPLETIIFEDSVPGIIAAETAGAGGVYIVNSYGEDYSRFSYEIITDFARVDRKLFV